MALSSNLVEFVGILILSTSIGLFQSLGRVRPTPQWRTRWSRLLMILTETESGDSWRIVESFLGPKGYSALIESWGIWEMMFS